VIFENSKVGQGEKQTHIIVISLHARKYLHQKEKGKISTSTPNSRSMTEFRSTTQEIFALVMLKGSMTSLK